MKALNIDDFEEEPTIKLVGCGGACTASYYSVVLSNHDDIFDIPNFGPIIHQMIVNVPLADLEAGDLSNGDVILAYAPPNSPAVQKDLHYSYLIFKQDADITDTSALLAMPQTQGLLSAFPVRDFMEEYGLTLVTSNYFVAEWRILSEINILNIIGMLF